MKKLLIVITSLLFIFGCNNQNKKKDVINIAAILSLTGNGAEYGQDQLNAIDLIKEEIAKNQDLKYSYKFYIQDSKSQPKEAVNAFQNLLARTQIDACLSVLSSVCLAIIPITEEKNIPIFCVGANPEITNNRKLVFRSLPTTDYQARVLAETVFEKMDLDSIAILYLNDDFGNGSKNSFKKIADTYNKSILSEQSIQPDENDYRTQITKILKQNPNAIYLATFGNSIATALIQLKELGFKGIILSTLEVAYPKVLERAKNSSEGVIFTDTYFGKDDSEFVRQYQKKFNKKPSLDVILAYDELQVLINSFERFGNNPLVLNKIKGADTTYSSPAGSFSINPLGDFEYSLYLKQIKNGEPIIVN